MAFQDFWLHLRRHRTLHQLVVLLLICSHLRPVNAQADYLDEPVLNCSSLEDDYVGNTQSYFFVKDWLSRGLCIRSGLDADSAANAYKCYSRLQNVLQNNLNELRKAEYSGAAGALAILPTIGATFGMPVNEIDRLRRLIPCLGLIALLCSFGGNVLPLKLDIHENRFMNQMSAKSDKARSTHSLPSFAHSNRDPELYRRIAFLLHEVSRRMTSHYGQTVPRAYIIVGVCGMLIVLAAAQASMLILELGSVLPWYCESKWWVHMWYLLVVATTTFDALYAQNPYRKTWKLRLADVPYDLEVSGGDSLFPVDDDLRHFAATLRQLKTICPATVHLVGAPQYRARPRNTVEVQISLLHDQYSWFRALCQILGRAMSIIVFIIGTGAFATAQLISVAMALFVILCVLAATIFARALNSSIVAGIETAEGTIHYVAMAEEEAHQAIASVLAIGRVDNGHRRKIQAEIDGHIFLMERRVAYRSPWVQRLFGVLVPPYDLGELVEKTNVPDDAVELGSMFTPLNLEAADKSTPLTKTNSIVSLDTALGTTSTFQNAPLPRASTFAAGTNARS